jgi:hypothetical protein
MYQNKNTLFTGKTYKQEDLNEYMRKFKLSGWLFDEEDPILPYLSKLVSAITNLSMDSAEQWQVGINYNIYIHFEEMHFSFKFINNKKIQFKF